jgi:hypothetical protein
MPWLETTGTIVIAHYPHIPPSEKNGDITGSALSANAAVGENGDNSGSTLSANAAPTKMGTLLVANYPQMPPSEKNGDITGSTLSANTAV